MERRLVATPKSFFVKERDQFYADWQLSFFREFFQNSVDAGAKNISVRVKEVPARGSFDDTADGTKTRTRVVVEDDGCGMTAEVLDKVYFAIGQTTKDDGTSVGGYGRARLMTCFSQARYSILTKDRFVLGDGPDYVNLNLEQAEAELEAAIVKVSDGQAAYEDRVASADGLREDLKRVQAARAAGGFKGCRVEIDIDCEGGRWHAPTPARMMDKLHQYLSESQLPCAVTVNGAPPEEAWATDGKLMARRGPVRKKLEAAVDGAMVQFATVHTSEGNRARHKKMMLVRVDGASMYSVDLEADVQVILEIDKAMSRAVLTSNRDGMKSQFRQVVDAFVAELNIDNRTAMEDLKSKSNYTVPGQKGMLLASAPALKEVAEAEADDGEIQAAREMAGDRASKIETVDQLAIHGLSQDIVEHFVRQVADGRGFLAQVADDYGFPLQEDASAFRRAVNRDYNYGSNEGVRVFLNHASDRLKAWVVQTLSAREHKAAETMRAVHEERLKDMHDVHVSIVSSNDRTKAAIRRNDPRKWDVSSGKGRAPRALLAAWTAACSVAVETLFRLRPATDGFDWTTGWVYSVPEEVHQGDRYRSASVEAMCQRQDGDVRFLLNPVRDDGSLRYSVSDAKDRQRLQALAMHEVGHVLENYHNETYAGVLTDLMKEFDMGDANRRMKDAVRAVMAAYEEGRATVQPMDDEPGPRPAERLLAYTAGNMQPNADTVTRNDDGTWSYDPDRTPESEPSRDHSVSAYGA